MKREKKTIEAEITNLEKELDNANEIAEHRRKFINKKNRMELLDSLMNIKNVASSYIRFLETGNKEWFDNYRRLYRVPTDEYLKNSYEPYEVEDEIKDIELTFIKLWTEAFPIIIKFESLIDEGKEKEINAENEIDKLRKAQSILDSLPSLWGCNVVYESLELVCPKK